jgi:16S rRNA (cytosine967-C5)-methyltransferase
MNDQKRARPGARKNDKPREPAEFCSRADPRASTSARWVAAHVLHRVAVDDAYAAPTLDAELAATGLDERDARLATEIVYGSLRKLPLLDARLDAQLTRGRPDPFTMAALRCATYQALFLRVPDFAIVQETVSIVKQKRGEGMGKLCNAVLRRVVESRPKEPIADARLALPEWIEQALEAGIGRERTARFIESQTSPPLSLRCADAAARDALLAALREARPEASLHASQLSPNVLYAQRVGDPRKLPGYAEGRFAVQDAGAGLVGALVDAQPGERVLDACAGRGGKTLQLLATVGASGRVTAIDVHARKLELLSSEAVRLGFDPAQLSTETIDLGRGDGGLEGGFDRVLVDAPCTGLGTLVRRPEIALRLGPNDPARLADLQFRILRRALSLLRPGGILVFAVCSGSAEEGRGVADRLEAADARILRLRKALPALPLTPDDDGVFRIGPWLAEGADLPDVYQVVRWQRLDSPTRPV